MLQLQKQVLEAGVQDALCDVTDEELPKVDHHGRHLCRHLHIKTAIVNSERRSSCHYKLAQLKEGVQQTSVYTD